jgi:hypothetical protein
MKANRRFGGTYRLNLQGARIRKQVTNWEQADDSILLGLLFNPKYGGEITPKRHLTSTGLHVIISQKMEFWLVSIAVWPTARNNFTHSNTRIVGSNLTQGIDICIYPVWVSALRRANHPSKGMGTDHRAYSVKVEELRKD